MRKDPTNACSPKSRYAQDPNYECHPNSGRMLPKKTLKRKLSVPRVDNPFMQWLAKNRRDLKRQFPALNPAELAREAGAIWNRLPLAARQEWKTNVEKQKIKYHEQVQNLRQKGEVLSTLVKRRQSSGITDYTQWIHAWSQFNPKPKDMSRTQRFEQKKLAWSLEKENARNAGRKAGSDLTTAKRASRASRAVEMAHIAPDVEPVAVQEWEGHIPPQESDD